MKYNFITIEGNIGAGKTTLAKMVAKEYGGQNVLEEFVANPFLPKFFEDPDRYAFSAELYFLADRYQQLHKVIQGTDLESGLTVSDYIFVKSLLYSKVNLKEDEFRLFERLFQIIYPELPDPELLVYVHSSPERLVQNIIKRGRDFEQGVRLAYLKQIENAYFDYFKSRPDLKILVIDTDTADFVQNKSHYIRILELINADYNPGIHMLKL